MGNMNLIDSEHYSILKDEYLNKKVDLDLM